MLNDFHPRNARRKTLVALPSANNSAAAQSESSDHVWASCIKEQHVIRFANRLLNVRARKALKALFVPLGRAQRENRQLCRLNKQAARHIFNLDALNSELRVRFAYADSSSISRSRCRAFSRVHDHQRPRCTKQPCREARVDT